MVIVWSRVPFAVLVGTAVCLVVAGPAWAGGSTPGGSAGGSAPTPALAVTESSPGSTSSPSTSPPSMSPPSTPSGAAARGPNLVAVIDPVQRWGNGKLQFRVGVRNDGPGPAAGAGFEYYPGMEVPFHRALGDGCMFYALSLPPSPGEWPLVEEPFFRCAQLPPLPAGQTFWMWFEDPYSLQPEALVAPGKPYHARVVVYDTANQDDNIAYFGSVRPTPGPGGELPRTGQAGVIPTGIVMVLLGALALGLARIGVRRRSGAERP
jgi:hypothetical protein